MLALTVAIGSAKTKPALSADFLLLNYYYLFVKIITLNTKAMVKKIAP